MLTGLFVDTLHLLTVERIKTSVLGIHDRARVKRNYMTRAFTLRSVCYTKPLLEHALINTQGREFFLKIRHHDLAVILFIILPFRVE